MCGICGVAVAPGSRPREDLIAAVEAMAGTLAHRGPDGRGAWADPEVGLALGHRRLAVIDPTQEGAQPMVSSCGRYRLVYNGELYNFRELRGELESEGRRFRGASDTEVLVEAIGAWGVARALRRLEGMFAFAVWDALERRLHLARDPVGKKPLYYARRGGLLWFGSELKALRAHPEFRATVDRASLAFFVRFSFVPAPRTIHPEAAKLEAGEHVVIPLARGVGEPERERFASLRAWAEQGERDPFRGTGEEALETLDGLLRGAVRRRLVADVPLGALLSGGIDSSLIVALMQEEASHAVRTFSIGYREPRHDEAPHARRVARHLGTEHTELRVTPEQARDLIPRLPSLYDEPFADTSQLPTALLCAAVRRRVTVALSGDGGDELFGGYPRYVRCLRRAGRLQRWPVWGRVALARALRAAAPARLERVAEGLAAGSAVGQFVSACARHPARLRLVLGDEGVAPRGPERDWPAIDDPLARLMALDLSGRLPESILVKVDRASMGAGLEVRSPLLDARVVAFALRLPTPLRVGAAGKEPLRRLLARRLPPPLFERPKQGFGMPIGEWLRGPLRDWGEALLAPARLRDEGFFDPQLVRQAWEQHQRSAPDRRFLIWNLLSFQSWWQAGA